LLAAARLLARLAARPASYSAREARSNPLSARKARSNPLSSPRARGSASGSSREGRVNPQTGDEQRRGDALPAAAAWRSARDKSAAARHGALGTG